MKLVTAVIKPHKWEDVRQALEAFGVTGMTVTEASGYGRQKGHTEVYRGAEYDVALVPKIRVELVVEDADATDVLGVITKAAAPSFQSGNGSASSNADAPIPKTGTSNANGLTVAAEWRWSSQPQAA
jgi:nitrogen regulatory protein P-II 1